MTNPRTFGDNLLAYAQAGWTCILPVPPETKTPPPVGYTGAEGLDTDALTLVRWSEEYATSSIALRMPPDVIGIDVDQYQKGEVTKHGAETLQAHLEQWGPLPATWSSTARGPGPSRIYFYRVPAQRYATRLKTGGEHPTGDVEIIQRHHRYAVVWPSFHHDAGDVYRWYDPAGRVVDAPPKPGELAELPAAWVAGLAEGAAGPSAAASDRSSGQALLDQLSDDWRPECAEITSAKITALDRVSSADAGSRHDTMTERTYHLVQLAGGGHTGVGAALLELRERWADLTAAEGRAEEFDRMLLGAARKAVTMVGAVQLPSDPCLMAGGFPAPAPAGRDPGAGDATLPDGTPLQIVELPRWQSLRQVIGTHAFDPNAGLDQSLAEKVLERTWPAMRYAYDSRGWLLRTPERWELHGPALAAGAVALVAPLMPVGDPSAEKGSEQRDRSDRRTRLMSAAGAGAVAKKIDALVGGGMHPVAVALSELDSEPEILWAGGLPYSLRESAHDPVVASLDPSTPHLSTAAVRPLRGPTPLWDAFTASVFPDPALRRWALRVLSITVTGYADRAMPILLGETGRGKTQLVALLMSVLGGYAHSANPKLLSASSNAHDSIVFALKGRRLSFIDEAPREARSGQERLKQLTGGGELTANQMNQNPITFRPTHTLVLTANDEPSLVDPAVRSRTRLIPCVGDPEQVRAARAAIGHVSSAAWRAEAPGVLAAMMAEAAAWLAEPASATMLAAPEEIRYLVEHIGHEQDPIAQWLEDDVEPFEPGTPSRELYQAFRGSCQRSGVRLDQVPSQAKWGRELTTRGWPGVHTRLGNVRQLRVRPSGFLPGMEPATPVESVKVTPPGEGSVKVVGGLPSQPNVQVNPREIRRGEGVKEENHIYTHTPAHTRARGSDLDCPSHLHGGTDLTQPDLAEQPVKVPPSETPAKPKRERSAAATERAAEKRAAARLEAIAAAAGRSVQLPAVVTRDGTVRAAAPVVADDLLATISGEDGELTVDVEHTGFPIGHRDYALRTVQLGNEVLAVVLDPADPDQAAVVRRHLARAAVLHAHSASADLVPLEVAGLLEHGIEEAWSRMHDTVIPAKLADPASTGSDPDLKKISAAVLGDQAVSPRADEARAALFKAGKWLTNTRVTTAPERSGWAQVDPRSATMVRYAAADVLDDAAIARRLPAIPPAILDRERLAQRMTARVAHHGLRIDGDHVRQLLPPQRDALADAAARLVAYGVDNPGSDQQVGAAALKLGAQLPPTKTGRPSVAAGVLEPLAKLDGDLGAFVRARLDYQKAETALGLFLEPYRLLVEHGDGRARPTVYTLGADTGRMSCVRPNLQQVPREGGFRACITADPGMVLVSADFANVEIRVAAALSQDRRLIEIIAESDRFPDEPNDPHWQIARIAFGADATKSDRYMAKRKVFGRIYGQGLEGMARTDGAGFEVAQAVISAMDAMAPGLTAWSQDVRNAVKAGHTQFPTYAGRIVHLDPALPHKAPNYQIQGTARELLIDGLVRWSATRWGDCVLLPVHDELLVMVPEDDAEAASNALVETMTSELYGIPIKVEASAPAKAWQDAS